MQIVTLKLMVLPMWRSCFQVGPSCFVPGYLSIQNGLSPKSPLGKINFLTVAWFIAWCDSRKVLFYSHIGQYLPQPTLGVLGRCVVWRLVTAQTAAFRMQTWAYLFKACFSPCTLKEDSPHLLDGQKEMLSGGLLSLWRSALSWENFAVMSL